MSLGNDPVVDELLEKVRLLSVDVARLKEQARRAHEVSCANATVINDEFAKLYARTETLREQDAGTRAWVRRTIRAHNRHVLAGDPETLAPGWARRRAQDARTWAKPKGWRL